MPKTVKEFKEIFSPIKKPKLPRGVSSKDKRALEADANSGDSTELLAGLARLGGARHAVAFDPAGMDPAEVVYDYVPGENKGKTAVFDPAKKRYAIDLIAYKVAKHMDDEEVFESWTKGVPGHLMDEVVRKIIPNDLTDPPTMKLYEKAFAQDNEHLLKLFGLRDTQGVGRLAAERNLQGDRDAAAKLSDETAGHLEEGDAAAARRAGKEFATVMQHGDPVAIARENPDMFFDHVMEGLRENSVFFAKSFGDPDTRKELREAYPKQWKRLAARAPMLALLDRVDDPGKDQSDQAKLGRIFDAVLDPKVMPLTYVATSAGYQVADCLSGPSEAGKNKLDNLKAQTGAPGPATDCHNLTSMVKQLVSAAFGSAETTLEFSSEGKTNGLVLTKPIKDIGTKGLIGNFKGNVVDVNGKGTGQVFYTGDGISAAHSWIVYKVMRDGQKVGELSFDPVFGTKDAEIAASIQEQDITWIVADQLAKTPGNKFIHKVADYTELPPELFDEELLDAIPDDAGDAFYPRNKVGITRYWTISDTDPREPPPDRKARRGKARREQADS